MTQQQKIEKENTPVPAKKDKASKSKKRGFFVYLIFMLLLAVGSGAAVYYTTPLVLASLAPKPSMIVKTIPAARARELSEPQPTEIVSNEPDMTNEEEENILSQDDDIIEVVTTFIPRETPVIEQSVVTAPTIQQPEKIETPYKKPSYSVLKAMELRDAFKNGGECRPLLEELVAMPDKTPDMDQALMELLQSCLDRPIAGQMQEAFHAAKKRAILRIFQTKYPTYIAYLKALPYFLANVRKKNPTGEDPLDILDRIQNAVEADHPQLVLKLIPELPENVQATLNDVTQLAEAESNLHRTLNRLMKALFDGGER